MTIPMWYLGVGAAVWVLLRVSAAVAPENPNAVRILGRPIGYFVMIVLFWPVLFLILTGGLLLAGVGAVVATKRPGERR